MNVQNAGEEVILPAIVEISGHKNKILEGVETVEIAVAMVIVVEEDLHPQEHGIDLRGLPLLIGDVGNVEISVM